MPIRKICAVDPGAAVRRPQLMPLNALARTGAIVVAFEKAQLMTTTITTFTHAANEAQRWVNELSDELACDERSSYRLLRSVLQSLRDWLSEAEMADLAAQLPILVRGIFFEGWNPSTAPARDRRKEQFIAHVQAIMPSEPLRNPDRAISAVFSLLDRHLDKGEIDQVRNSLKKQLRELWPTD